jgi:hypothetical protein
MDELRKNKKPAFAGFFVLAAVFSSVLAKLLYI